MNQYFREPELTKGDFLCQCQINAIQFHGGADMKRLSRIVFLSVILLSVLCIFSLSHAANTIKVGIVDTYTGPATTFTNDVLDGFKLAVERINAAGGILGKKIEYTTRDEKFKPDIGLAMAKELILKEKVDILMGTINSATTLAISDFVKKGKGAFLRHVCKK